MILLLILLFPIAIIWRGWVLSVLWGWFLVPLGAPHLGVIPALGISLVASLLTDQGRRRDEDTDAAYIVGYALLGPLFVLAIGFVLHLFQ